MKEIVFGLKKHCKQRMNHQTGLLLTLVATTPLTHHVTMGGGWPLTLTMSLAGWPASTLIDSSLFVNIGAMRFMLFASLATDGGLSLKKH